MREGVLSYHTCVTQASDEVGTKGTKVDDTACDYVIACQVRIRNVHEAIENKHCEPSHTQQVVDHLKHWVWPTNQVSQVVHDSSDARPAEESSGKRIVSIDP